MLADVQNKIQRVLVVGICVVCAPKIFYSPRAFHFFLNFFTADTSCPILCVYVYMLETEADIHECVKMGYIDKNILGPLLHMYFFF